MKKVDIIQRWDEKDENTIEWDVVVDGEILKTYNYKTPSFNHRAMGFLDALKAIYGEDQVECGVDYK
jgi:hypothetical protein